MFWKGWAVLGLHLALNLKPKPYKNLRTVEDFIYQEAASLKVNASVNFVVGGWEAAGGNDFANSKPVWWVLILRDERSVSVDHYKWDNDTLDWLLVTGRLTRTVGQVKNVIFRLKSWILPDGWQFPFVHTFTFRYLDTRYQHIIPTFCWITKIFNENNICLTRIKTKINTQ